MHSFPTPAYSNRQFDSKKIHGKYRKFELNGKPGKFIMFRSVFKSNIRKQ